MLGWPFFCRRQECAESHEPRTPDQPKARGRCLAARVVPDRRRGAGHFSPEKPHAIIGIVLNAELNTVSFTLALKSAIKRLPPIRKLVEERDNLLLASKFAPPGHFYSPIPAIEDIARDDARIFGVVPRTIPGIDLRETQQLELLNSLIEYYRDMPFQPGKTANMRYYFENPSFSYSDATFLHCMIRHLKPRRIIEVGSGFSSCVTLDTNDLFFNGSIETTFIEPYPALILSLLNEGDKLRTEIIAQRLQEVELDCFSKLQANDILFIDSTHVSKIDSDVNRILFDILPSLAPGVYIHFHDIAYPFEYPKAWIYEGRAWNEIYALRAFLQYNNKFTIELMNTYMGHFHPEFFERNMPLCLKNPGGSIWLRKS